jgi:3-methylcrotonyl-CoA carboxylase alpha subunit
MPTVMHMDGQEHQLEIVARRPELVLRVDGALHIVRPITRGFQLNLIEVDGRQVRFHAASEGAVVHVRCDGRSHRVAIHDPRDARGMVRAAGDEIVAEMPGTLVAIVKAQGEEVVAGDVVVSIEIMKLLMNLSAPRAGRIARIAVELNQTFDKGAILVMLEPAVET